MTITFSCEECGTTLNVKDELAGKKGKCPRCQASVVVPESEAEVPARTARDHRANAPGGAPAAVQPSTRVQNAPQQSSSVSASALVDAVRNASTASGYRCSESDLGELVIEKGNLPLSFVLGAIAPYSKFVVSISSTNPGVHQCSLRRNTPWWTGVLGVSQVRKRFDSFVATLVQAFPQGGARVLNHNLDKETAEITVVLPGQGRSGAGANVCPLCAEVVETSAARCKYCGHRF